MNARTLAAFACAFLSTWLPHAPLAAQAPEPTLAPLVRWADLDVGEATEIELSDGKKVRLKLLDVRETRDPLRQAVRKSVVKVDVGGTEVELEAGNYRLPTTVAGVQVDCAVTKGYIQNNSKGTFAQDPWGLAKAARLRVWPAGSAWMNPHTFRYPARQRWFATGTQMANEPTHVDGGDDPGAKSIYYHYGLDIGGSEGRVDVIAATDGLVVSSGTAVLPGYEDSPVKPRYDVVYLLDPRGWYYRYSHLKSIDAAIRPGQAVKIGQAIGVLGKEGGSGGWSHLHFDISARQPSGRWGIVEGYAFLWEAYLAEHKPSLVAVARPHQLAAVGQRVVLDASRSWSKSGKIARYAWRFTDGTTAEGAAIERTYAKPGVYSEVLSVTNEAGETEFDFAVVNVLDPQAPGSLPPSIHLNYAPTFDVKAGDPVTFKVRTFRTTDGREKIDFGDGSPAVEVQSDGNVKPLAADGYAETVHRFEKPGHYVVRAERTNGRGESAVGHVSVRVGPP